MEELIQELKALVNAIESDSVPLWVSIFGIIVPIIISIAVAVITHIQNKKDKELQKQINYQYFALKKAISSKEIKVQMHSDVLKIYDELCMAQNSIGIMEDKVHIIFSNFNMQPNGVNFPSWIVNNLEKTLNVVCQAVNRARLIFPANDKIIEVINYIYCKYKCLVVKIVEYYYNGNAYNVAKQAEIKSEFSNHRGNGSIAYKSYFEACKTNITE